MLLRQQPRQYRVQLNKMASTDLPIEILRKLDSATNPPLLSSSAFPNVEPTVLKGALDSLHSREMVKYKTIDREVAVLTEEGSGIAQDGSHEAKVYEAVCNAVEGLKISDLPVTHLRELEGTVESQLTWMSGDCWHSFGEGGPRKGFQGGMDQEGGRPVD